MLYELVFCIMIDMETTLTACDAAIAGIAAVEVSALTRDALGVAVVRVQGMIDRLTMAHARIVTEADRAGVWGGRVREAWPTGWRSRPRPRTATQSIG